MPEQTLYSCHHKGTIHALLTKTIMKTNPAYEIPTEVLNHSQSSAVTLVGRKIRKWTPWCLGFLLGVPFLSWHREMDPRQSGSLTKKAPDNRVGAVKTTEIYGWFNRQEASWRRLGKGVEVFTGFMEGPWKMSRLRDARGHSIQCWPLTPEEWHLTAQVKYWVETYEKKIHA